jgi:hypothetical protein
MSENTVVKIEPKVRPRLRAPYKRKLKASKKQKPVAPQEQTPPITLFGMEKVLGGPLLAFCMGVGGVLVGAYDVRQRRNTHRLLLMMAGAMMVLFGTLKMALMLLRH